MGMDTSLSMKANLFRSVLALIALSFATGLQAAASSGTATMPAPLSVGEIALDTVTAPKNVNGDSVTAGASRIVVSMRLGKPDRVLRDGTWLYQGYHARRTFAGERGADRDPSRETSRSETLIVRFAAQKVVSLSLGDETTIAALRENPKNPASRTLLASSDQR